MTKVPPSKSMSASGRSRRLSCWSWRLCTCSGACDLTEIRVHNNICPSIKSVTSKHNLPSRLLQVLPGGDCPCGAMSQGVAQRLPGFFEADTRWNNRKASSLAPCRTHTRLTTYHLRDGPGSRDNRPRCSKQRVQFS